MLQYPSSDPSNDRCVYRLSSAERVFFLDGIAEVSLFWMSTRPSCALSEGISGTDPPLGPHPFEWKVVAGRLAAPCGMARPRAEQVRESQQQALRPLRVELPFRYLNTEKVRRSGLPERAEAGTERGIAIRAGRA